MAGQSPPLYFHDDRPVTMQGYAGRYRNPCFVRMADCAQKGRRSGCVPSYVRQWQDRIRSELPRAWKQRFMSCAVVGSSPTLLNAPLGRSIDAAEAVFRVNEAPTRGYEEYAGTKTKIRLWGAPAGWHQGDARGSSYVWGERPSSLPLGAEEFTVIKCPEKTSVCRCWDDLGNRSRPAHPRLGPLVWERLRNLMRAETAAAANYTYTVGKFPSTGALAVYLALQSCQWPVRLYGFGNCSPSKAARYYGYRWRGMNLSKISYLAHAGAYHDLRMEWLWLRALVRSGAAVVEDASARSVLCSRTRLPNRRPRRLPRKKSGTGRTRARGRAS